MTIEPAAIRPSPSPAGAVGRRLHAPSGIRGKLQAAFAAVAALTVIAAAVALVSFSRIENGMQRVVGEQVPTMTDAMQLSVLSSNISAAVARFVSAKTADDQLAAITLIELRHGDLGAVIERVRERRGGNSILDGLRTLSLRIAPNLQAVQDAISDRSGLQSRLQAQLDSMHKAHARIGELLGPVPSARYALEISANANLVSSLLGAGSIVREAAALAPIQARFRIVANELQKATEKAMDENLSNAAAILLQFGEGSESIFALRGRELYASVRADSAVDENASIQRDLEHIVSTLLSEAETGMRQSASNLIVDLDRNRAVLLSVAIVSILSAIAIGVFYVQRRLIRRLSGIGDAMRRLSAGDIDIKVPALGERDEIGEMARSLEIFRAGEIERRSLSERERSEQTAQHARAAAIERTIAEFRTTFAGAIGAVAENVSRMETTAATLSTIAREADHQARAVSLSSEATSSSVRSVAGAADQLSGSILEISAQASQANGVVQHAAEIARSTDRRVEQLSEGASRIGDVVRLIRDIAEQTNLLALNATIEAARAGEAGRGFAVVASEVKTLASQTAKATEDIAAQIGAMQSSTIEAVDSIRSISAVMQDISSFTAAIAGAVEEQSTSTQQIVRNVQQAANGAKELAGNMVVVTEAIEQTNQSASAVLDASNALSAQASMLQGAVDVFLNKVSAS